MDSMTGLTDGQLAVFGKDVDGRSNRQPNGPSAQRCRQDLYRPLEGPALVTRRGVGTFQVQCSVRFLV